LAACGRGGAFGGRRVAPYDSAVSVATAEKPELADPKPPAHLPWIRALSEYDLRTTSDVHGTRYG
jgi:hypothetical protein